MDTSLSDNVDNFRESFKNYKRKIPLPDFSEVIDFRNITTSDKQIDAITHVSSVKLSEPSLPRPKCLSHVETWKAYSLNDHPGFIIVTNPFVRGYERYWVKRCLEDYTQPPHHSNLDALVGSSGWTNAWLSSLSSDDKKSRLLDKLHWVTLGMHHNWDTKEYAVNERCVMPLDLCLVTQYIASTFGFVKYLPEAAILNYYHIGSTLGGHTDHSEFNRDAPIISFSFGCSGVFLLGGTTKAVRPTAMFIDSGDIVIMSGQSRLAYHAVPRILTAADRHVTTHDDVMVTCTQQHCTDIESSEIQPLCQYTDDQLNAMMNSLNCLMDSVLSTINWSPFEQFLSRKRINLNVRQVFQDPLTVDRA